MLISVSKVYNRKADFSYIALFFYYCKRKKRSYGFFFEFRAKESENEQFSMVIFGICCKEPVFRPSSSVAARSDFVEG